MKKNSYNGWKNRSTWLVEVHMNNTSAEVYELYKGAAVNADTKKQFQNQVTTHLIPLTKICDEEQFLTNEIDWNELWDNNRVT